MAQFREKLYTNFCAEKYTDVTIECADGNFKCHRVVLASASEFFEAMLGGHFLEGTSETVALPEMETEVFSLVLTYIYTGDVGISTGNVFALLRASDFLGITDLEDLCVQFIEKNAASLTIQSALYIYMLACATSKERLRDPLCRYIASRLAIFSKIEDFLELEFEDLKLILDQLLSPSTPTIVKNDESLLSALERWIRYRPDQRLRHVGVLKYVNYENISLGYIAGVTSRRTKTIGYEESASVLAENPFEETQMSLHVYVKHGIEGVIRVYANHGNGNWVLSTEMEQRHPEEWVRCATSADNYYLYSLHYFRSDQPSPSRYWPKQKFCAYKSADLSGEIHLKAPPISFLEMSLARLRNNIYAYNELDVAGEQTDRMESGLYLNVFGRDEVDHGVYAYNCDIDAWFPIQKMKPRLEASCMVASDELLYLIGGETVVGYVPAGYAQAYDPRAGWRTLPASNYGYTAAAGCAIDGKIYVCGGRDTGRVVERYDPAAGKWEVLTPMRRRKMYHRAVHFSNRLWAVRSFDTDGFPTTDSAMEAFDVRTSTWKSEKGLKRAVSEYSFTYGTIMDAFVFR